MSKCKKAKTCDGVDSTSHEKKITSDNFEWNRTGDKDKDHLHLYETGMMYDCTIRVSNQDHKSNNYQDFKCHKMVLGSASPVLQKMLFGSFKEATYGRDEPIPLKDVQPKAFDLAMKYIYGRKVAFGKDILTSIALYKFADFMDIKQLKAEIEKHWNHVRSEDVMALIDFWLLRDDKEKLKSLYWDLKNNHSAKIALESEHWLSVSEETVREVFSVFSLEYDSDYPRPFVHLLQALSRWGKANFPDLNDEELRTKLDPYIKKIKFGHISPFVFANLCKDLTILTLEEKYKILLCHAKGSTEDMPEGFDKDFTDFVELYSYNNGKRF